MVAGTRVRHTIFGIGVVDMVFGDYALVHFATTYVVSSRTLPVSELTEVHPQEVNHVVS